MSCELIALDAAASVVSADVSKLDGILFFFPGWHFHIKRKPKSTAMTCGGDEETGPKVQTTPGFAEKRKQCILKRQMKPN